LTTVNVVVRQQALPVNFKPQVLYSLKLFTFAYYSKSEQNIFN